MLLVVVVNGLCYRAATAGHGVNFVMIICFVMAMEARSGHSVHNRVARTLVMEGRVERMRSVKKMRKSGARRKRILRSHDIGKRRVSGGACRRALRHRLHLAMLSTALDALVAVLVNLGKVLEDLHVFLRYSRPILNGVESGGESLDGLVVVLVLVILQTSKLSQFPL